MALPGGGHWDFMHVNCQWPPVEGPLQMEPKVCIYFLIDQMDSKAVLYPGPEFHHRLEIH